VTEKLNRGNGAWQPLRNQVSHERQAEQTLALRCNNRLGLLRVIPKKSTQVPPPKVEDCE